MQPRSLTNIQTLHRFLLLPVLLLSAVIVQHASARDGVCGADYPLLATFDMTDGMLIPRAKMDADRLVNVHTTPGQSGILFAARAPHAVGKILFVQSGLTIVKSYDAGVLLGSVEADLSSKEPSRIVFCGTSTVDEPPPLEVEGDVTGYRPLPTDIVTYTAPLYEYPSDEPDHPALSPMVQ